MNTPTHHTKIQVVTPADLKKWLNNNEAVLVDVREIEEYTQHHIQEAVNIPLSEVSLTHQSLPNYNGKHLVFQCKSGKRSMVACEKIYAEGKENNLYNLTGGIEAWMENNLPVQNGETQS